MLPLASVSPPPKSLPEGVWKLERQSQCTSIISPKFTYLHDQKRTEQSFKKDLPVWMSKILVLTLGLEKANEKARKDDSRE